MPQRFFLFSFFVLCLLGFSARAQQDTLQIYGSSASGTQGEVVKVEIRVNNFTDILSFQASLNWDPALLEYVAVNDFGIKDFSANNFGTSTTASGHLRFIWEPSDAIAISETDSTVLFSVDFEILSDEPQDVSIGYEDVTSSPPFKVEFANKDFEILNVKSYGAQVSITLDPVDQVSIMSNPNTSCDAKIQNGSLSATVMGSSANHIYHWFNGSEANESPDFIGNPYVNLAAGNYTLRVLNLDESIFVDQLAATIVDAPAGIPDKITITQNVAQSSCSNDPSKYTGAIEINVNDAQPVDTYDIKWWKGSYDAGEEMTIYEDLFEASQLQAGSYEVKIINRSTNCASYHAQIIEEELVQFSIQLSMTENNYCTDGANGSVLAEVPQSDLLDLRYYWFDENMDIDTTLASARGPLYENLSMGTYRSWVIDLNSECSSSETIAVTDEPIFFEPLIEQKDDTLFANTDLANWYQEETDLQRQSSYLVPESTGNYSFTVTNEFNCQSSSEEMYFGVTSLLEPVNRTMIYPNPFIDNISISNPELSINSIYVLDSKGVLLDKIYDLKDKFINIQLSGSANGIYLLRINQSGKSYSRKVVKIPF